MFIPLVLSVNFIIQIECCSMNSFILGFFYLASYLRLSVLLQVTVLYSFHCFVIVFYADTMFYLFVLLLMDIWVVSIFWLWWIMLLWPFLCMFFGGHKNLFVCFITRNGTAGLYACLALLDTAKQFSRNGSANLYHDHQCMRILIDPHCISFLKLP